MHDQRWSSGGELFDRGEEGRQILQLVALVDIEDAQLIAVLNYGDPACWE